MTRASALTSHQSSSTNLARGPKFSKKLSSANMTNSLMILAELVLVVDEALFKPVMA